MHSMTKKELLSFADEHGVEGVSTRSTKSAIIESIEAAL